MVNVDLYGASSQKSLMRCTKCVLSGALFLKQNNMSDIENIFGERL